MIFLHPAILAGLLAIGLPVAIHLFSKPRLRRMPWAATRFLLNSFQKNRQRTKVEDILLLLLRCGLIALLVLIFARPALLTNGTGLSIGGETSTAVLLLDNSGSMGQSDGEQTRFDEAKTLAQGILSKLGPGSSCALYLAANEAIPLIPKPTQDFTLLRRFLAQAPLTDRGTDLLAGVKAAMELLKSSPGPHREIFLLTDSQASAWRNLDQIRQLQAENRKEITLRVIVIGNRGEDNVAISGLQMIGTAAAINQPLRCTVEVTNWGKTAVEKIPVKLSADDASPQDEGMIGNLDPGQSATLPLFVRFRDPGYHSLTANIPGDRLPSDNQRSLALLVLDQIHVLVVEGATNPNPASRDGFFLRHALVPVSPEEAARYYLQVTMGTPPDLESSAIDKYQLIFLSNVRQPTPLGTQNLSRYVAQGGALVVFPGPATDFKYANTDPPFSALLPATLGPAENPPTGQKFLAWQGRNYEHPITSFWNDPASGSLGSVRVWKYFPLALKTAASGASPPQVVVAYADGTPAAVEQAVGRGKVFLFGSSATTAWSTLPIHPAFVPFLMRLTSYATRGPAGSLDLAPGQPFLFPLNTDLAGQDFSVRGPGEKQRRPIGKIEAGEKTALIHFRDTNLAGVYQLFIGDEPKPRVVFAVQGDPAESDLIQESKTDLEPLLAEATSSSGSPAEPKAAAPLVPGREMGYPLAVAALLLALLETALAHRFSQPK